MSKIQLYCFLLTEFVEADIITIDRILKFSSDVNFIFSDLAREVFSLTEIISMKISRILEELHLSLLSVDPLMRSIYEKSYPQFIVALSRFSTKADCDRIDGRVFIELENTVRAHDVAKTERILKDMLDSIRLWCVGCDVSASADGREQTAMRLMLIERIDGILSGERFLQPNEADILRETRENLRSMFLPRSSIYVQSIFLKCMRCLDAIEYGEGSARELSELVRQWKEMT